MCSALCITSGESPPSTLGIMDREDPSAVVLLSCDEGISEQLSDQAAGDSPYISGAYFPVCCEILKKPQINEEQEDAMRCPITSNAPGNLGQVKAVKMQLYKQIRRGKPREGGTAPLWSIIHTFPSSLEIFSPTFPCICPPSMAVYLYLNYSVICQRSCMTSYPFPGTPHRRRWRNEAWQNRTLSSASKWSKSPQPPQTNTRATDARVAFLLASIDARRSGQVTQRHTGVWTCEMREEQKNTVKKTCFDSTQL